MWKALLMTQVTWKFIDAAYMTQWNELLLIHSRVAELVHEGKISCEACLCSNKQQLHTTPG